jgi:SH3 domain protein
MQKYLFMVLIILLLFPSLTYSETRYVLDRIVITVRSQPGLDYKILYRLASDEKVNVLRTEGSWSRISSKDNETGWAMTRFLTKETPKAIKIAELEKTVTTQAEKIEAMEKERTTLKQGKAELAEAVSNLKIDNESLKEEPYRVIMLLAGSGIFLMGCIVTLILQRTGRKKRDKLSF